MSWAAGLIVLCLLLIAVWAGAELVGRSRREWIKRLQGLERGRTHQQADYLDADTFFTNRNRP